MKYRKLPIGFCLDAKSKEDRSVLNEIVRRGVRVYDASWEDEPSVRFRFENLKGTRFAVNENKQKEVS